MSRRIYAVLAMIVILAVCATGSTLAAEQVSIEARVKPILTVDGLQFKDLNNNGKLDVYEDWRADIDDRIADLGVAPFSWTGLRYATDLSLVS